MTPEVTAVATSERRALPRLYWHGMLRGRA